MNKIPLKDLEELVAAGVIPQETSDRITNYYQEKKQSAPNTFTIILGILGALLTGSGIMLIIAHNWDDLSVTVKTSLAFLPLVIGQAACIFTFFKRKSDRTWIECSSMFLFFAIGGCISLIGQIYQVNGSLPGFLLAWVLLSLPLVYILSANIPALFCIAAITWYAMERAYAFRDTDIPYMYGVVLAILIPRYYTLYKKNPQSNFFNLFNWFAAASIAIALGALVNNTRHNLEEWLFMLYCILFCIYYLIGRLPLFESRKLFLNPFLIIGTLGIIVTLLAWSFEFIWKEYKMPDANVVFNGSLFYFMAGGTLIAAYLTWKSDRFRFDKLVDPLGYSFVVLLLLLICCKQAPSFAVFVVNAWTIFVAVFFIRKGSLRNHFGILNFGLTIIAALAICRFFDERIPFVWRGIFFLLTGIAFFAANYLMLKKRKQQDALVQSRQ